MKTIFNQATREEIKNRVTSLTETSKAQWGKMTVYQMIRHCSNFEEMMLGRVQYKRAFAGRLFGRFVLKVILKDESPLRRSTPTLPQLIITGNGDIKDEKAKWLDLIDEYAYFTNHNFIHPFFGKMTAEQIGYMVYKHCDHHLRQFNA